MCNIILMYINFDFMAYDCYALHQYGSILGIQLTKDVFVEELPDVGPMRTETCSSHLNKPTVESYLGLN
jgi:hypothetical protein